MLASECQLCLVARTCSLLNDVYAFLEKDFDDVDGTTNNAPQSNYTFQSASDMGNKFQEPIVTNRDSHVWLHEGKKSASCYIIRQQNNLFTEPENINHFQYPRKNLA